MRVGGAVLRRQSCFALDGRTRVAFVSCESLINAKIPGRTLKDLPIFLGRRLAGLSILRARACPLRKGPSVCYPPPKNTRMLTLARMFARFLLPCLAFLPYLCRWTPVVLGMSRPC